ncbi:MULTISPECIES: acyltransferase domain-containing protein [Streptomycetaceae]|nr:MULTISPECIES: acyltransferase domain-containing protein [Streptomycetaceae]
MSLDPVAVVGRGYRPSGAAGSGTEPDALLAAAGDALAQAARDPAAGVFAALAPGAGVSDAVQLARAVEAAGPCRTVDAERVPSLLTVRLAWQAVRLGECAAALAVVGHGDGAAALLLKRLSVAVAAGDPVLAVVADPAEPAPTASVGPEDGPLAGLARLADVLGTRWPDGARAPWPLALDASGADGTTTRLVLAAPPAAKATANTEDAEPHLLLFSAPSRAELAALVAEHRALAAAGAHGQPGVPALAGLAAAAHANAGEHPYRAAAVARTHAELVEKLDELTLDPPDLPADERGLVFVFAGQGHQWLGMGRELLRTEPAFRAAVERCDAAVGRHVPWSVREELLRDEARSRLGEIDVLQPVLFTVQVALARMWQAWGVEPDAVVGHSMGEIAAAHVSGALSLADAATIACRRSALLRRITGQGALAVVELDPASAAELADSTGGRVSVAGVNSPALCVLAGDAGSLEEITRRLEDEDVYAKLIRSTVASHSHYVDGLRDDLFAALDGLRPGPATVPMYSTVTLERLAGPELTAGYWMRNLREPVRFADVVAALRRRGHGVFLEISGHPVLSSPVRQCLEHAGVTGRALFSSRRHAERASVLASLGALYTLGRAPRPDGPAPAAPVPAPAAGAARHAPTPYQAALLPAVLGRR